MSSQTRLGDRLDDLEDKLDWLIENEKRKREERRIANGLHEYIEAASGE